MRVTYLNLDELPRPAWRARVTRGGDVLVRRGPRVEVRGDAFVEGAWDGPFDRFRFDEPKSFTRSGGPLSDDGMLFATCTHPLE